MSAQKKPAKVPAKVVEKASSAVRRPAQKPESRLPANERKAKVVAALKRLHPMD